MFSLIISIIAIALVIVLAGASLYYGGDAFNQGTAKGEFAKITNEAQQVAAAITLAQVNGVSVTETDTNNAATGSLANYLASATSTNFTIDLSTVGDEKLTVSGVPTDVCDAFEDADGNQVNPLASCAAGEATYKL